MADGLSQLLISFANFSNITVVVTILLCFMTTAVFILRFNNDLFHLPAALTIPSPHTATHRTMETYTNPFSVQLCDPITASLRDGFTLSISSVAGGSVAAFWCASIDRVHELLQLSVPSLLDQLASGQLLQGDGDCLHSEPLARLERGSRKDVHYACPAIVAAAAAALGQPPRQHYPCVVVTAVAPHPTPDQPSVIANFLFLHLRDPSVPMASQIVGNFLKLADGRVFNLQSLFLASDVARSQQTGFSGSATNIECDLSSTGDRCLQTNLSSSTSSTECGDSATQCGVGTCECSIDERDGVPLCESSDSGVGIHGLSFANTTHEAMDESETVQSKTSILTNPDSGSSHHAPTNEDSSDPHAHSCNHTPPSDPDDLQRNGVSSGQGFTVVPESSTADVDSPRCRARLSSHGPAPATSMEVHADLPQPECVVCQTNAISHVILPCRHACTCRPCFLQVNRCPMCRGIIETYFTLYTDGSTHEVEPPQQAEMDPGGFVNWVFDLNDRINEYLGFT